MSQKTRGVPWCKAPGIDIFDLNYDISTESRETLLHSPPYPQRSHAGQIRAFLDRLLNTRGDFTWPEAALPENSVLSFVCTANEMDTLEPLVDEVDRHFITGVRRDVPRRFPDCSVPFPFHHAHLCSLPFYPLVWYHRLRSAGYRRKSFLHAFHNYWTTYGLYVVSRFYLRRLNPAAVLVANDHVVWPRTFSRAAGDEGIPTIYIPHGMVSPAYPELGFDYALLFGRAMAETYDQIGSSNTKVFLTGIPKFDQHLEAEHSPGSVHKIGLCVSRRDDPDIVREVSEVIHAECPALEVRFRPHPRDDRTSTWQTLCERLGFTFSDPDHEDVFAFLNQVDAVVADDSTVHLEAALLNTYPLRFDLTGHRFDRCGFLEGGLTDFASGADELAEKLKRLTENKPDVQAKAAYYCSTVNTRFKGQSTALVRELLDQIVHGNPPEKSRVWRPANGFDHLAVFEPGGERKVGP